MTTNKHVLYAAAFVVTAFVTGILCSGSNSLTAQDPPEAKKGEAAERPFGIQARTPWTTSRITGSPEPPHPYRVERVFPKLSFTNPLLLVRAPGLNRFFVAAQAGKLYSFPIDPKVEKADLFLDLTTEIKSWDPNGKVKGVGAVYALVFHPKFQENRYCYICYILDSKKQGEDLPDGTRVSRFRVSDTDPPRVDPASEKVILTWLAGGHNGCDLHFGPDGFLYISTGDATAPNPPDGLDTGQDLSDLLSSILRMDVDHEDAGQAYAVPADNPFVKTPGARPEIWAYGFRNPWRMSFDRVTGDLWVGDVGWEQWELVYRIQRGGNYGWSVMEGRQVVRPESRRGPTPILPPALDFPHTECASVTGGYVYRGKSLPDLAGSYICGDWQTGRLWATRFDGERIVSHREISHSKVRVVAFGEDAGGELYFVDHAEGGGIYQLVPNEVKDTSAAFPRKLSETGLFASAPKHELAAGVVPFSINAEQWTDHATAERFLGLPGDSTVKVYNRRVHIPPWHTAQIFLPKDGVLAKTFTLEMERGNAQSRRRIETQILHYDGDNWRGYSYRWNDDQTDAELVPAAGADQTLTVVDAKAPGGKRQQTWHFPARGECFQCHNVWSGYPLAFNLPQLAKEHDYGGRGADQLRTLRHIGVITPFWEKDKPQGTHPLDKPPAPLVNPHNGAASLDTRARSYLHANCAHCHQFGAGGTALIDLRYDISLAEMKAVEAAPVQGTFEIHGTHILAPGDPYRSVLYYRMSKLGPGRMPHIGSQVVDEPGLRLMHDWIRQLPIRKDDRLLIERLSVLDEAAFVARERAELKSRLDRLAKAISKTEGREEVTAEDRKKAEAQERTEAEARAKSRAAERTETINRLLSSTSSALLLAQELSENRLPESVRAQVLAAATARPEPQVRDLFERFLPDELRLKRLGSVFKPEQILALKGDAGRGKELFFKSSGLQCVNCHRIADAGSNLGPELTQIAKKYTKVQLLETILEPSKAIEPKYVPYLAETIDGQVHTGLLAEKNEREIVLKNAGDKEIRLPANKVERLVPQQKSLMPDLLLRDLSAEQAADLLEFLGSLK